VTRLCFLGFDPHVFVVAGGGPHPLQRAPPCEFRWLGSRVGMAGVDVFVFSCVLCCA